MSSGNPGPFHRCIRGRGPDCPRRDPSIPSSSRPLPTPRPSGAYSDRPPRRYNAPHPSSRPRPPRPWPFTPRRSDWLGSVPASPRVAVRRVVVLEHPSDPIGGPSLLHGPILGPFCRGLSFQVDHFLGADQAEPGMDHVSILRSGPHLAAGVTFCCLLTPFRGLSFRSRWCPVRNAGAALRKSSGSRSSSVRARSRPGRYRSARPARGRAWSRDLDPGGTWPAGLAVGGAAPSDFWAWRCVMGPGAGRVPPADGLVGIKRRTASEFSTSSWDAGWGPGMASAPPVT